MRVSIFGLGYVGTVSAGCLANDGHEVIGVDPVPTKVDLINSGKSPIIEADIGEIIASNVKSGRLRATSDPAEAIRRRSCRSFASARRASPMAISTCATSGASANRSARRSRAKPNAHTVVIRSTILPGTMHKIVIPILEEILRKEGRYGFRRLPQSRVSARRFGGEGFQCSSQDRDRRARSRLAATCSPPFTQNSMRH